MVFEAFVWFLAGAAVGCAVVELVMSFVDWRRAERFFRRLGL